MFGDSEYVLFSLKIQTLNGIARRVLLDAPLDPRLIARTHMTLSTLLETTPFFFNSILLRCLREK